MPRRGRNVGPVLLASFMLRLIPAFGQVPGSAGDPIYIDAANSAMNLRRQPKLDFSAKLRRNGIWGTVEVEMTVSEKGDVVSERAVSGEPELEKAAIKAFKKAKFNPFVRDGKPTTALAHAMVRYAKDGAVTLNPEQTKPVQGSGALEVMSDTMGVDFGLYLQQVRKTVQANWYKLVPEEGRTGRGRLVIAFAILKDGRVSAMKINESSGRIALDRAAWGGISSSNPFAPLPMQFKGEYLLLRFTFWYNPEGGVVKP
jgi:TonB family protein